MSPLLVGGLLAGAVVATGALYLLRERRPRLVVPWAALVPTFRDESPAEALWRRLRRILSWLLHVAVVAALALAALDPDPLGGRPPERLVLVVDASASMRARDRPDAEPREVIARKRARALVEALGPGDQVLVIRAGARAAALGPWRKDRALALATLGALRAGPEPADLPGALALARDALSGQAGRVIVLSDGAALPAELGRGLDLRFEASAPEGAAPPDLAVTGLAVRRRPSNRLSSEAWVGVANRGDTPATAVLSVETEAGDPLYAETLALGPRQEASRALADLATRSSRIVARIKAATGSEDLYADDDTARAVAPERRRRKVRLCTSGNFFLEGALLLDRAVALDVRAPGKCAEGARPDVAILDRVPAARAPAGAPLLLLGADIFDKADEFVAARGVAERPLLGEADKKHPVTRWIGLGDVNVKRAARLVARAGDAVLAKAGKEPAALAGRRDGRRFVALGFSLDESDLPLRVGFPVLLVNALDWLCGDDDPTAAQGLVGRAVVLELADGDVTVHDGDAAEPARVESGELRVVPRAPGFLRIEGASGKVELAVGLPPEEQGARASGKLLVGDRVVPAPERTSAAGGKALRDQLLLLALALLVLELFSFHRRLTA